MLFSATPSGLASRTNPTSRTWRFVLLADHAACGFCGAMFEMMRSVYNMLVFTEATLPPCTAIYCTAISRIDPSRTALHFIAFHSIVRVSVLLSQN